MSKLRIGVDAVTPGMSLAPGAGGMRMYVNAITRAMHDTGEDSDFVLFENPHARMPELMSLPRLRVTPCLLAPRNRTARVIYQNCAYPFVVRSSHVDALLATCNVLPLGLKVPSVVVIQSLQFFEQARAFGSWRRNYLRTTLKASVKRAAFLICLSKHSKQALIELTGVNPSKVEVVYHGLPPSYRPAKADLRYSSPGEPYILNVSSLHAYKNVLRLIEAYALLRHRDHVRQRLRIIGYEAEYTRRDIEMFARRLGIVEWIDFLGPITNEELPAQYANADLFVYPSLYETFGLPPLEAMATGCPVVAARSSSIPEVVGDGAELVEPLDVESIATGMHRILTDGARRADLVRRGHLRASSFTWERAGRQTLDVLKRATGVAATQ